MRSPLGNLKEYVLNGRCEETILVTFLSQVASALQYLHENHIVHTALRAEHVNVVEFEEVKKNLRCHVLLNGLSSTDASTESTEVIFDIHRNKKTTLQVYFHKKIYTSYHLVLVKLTINTAHNFSENVSQNTIAMETTSSEYNDMPYQFSLR